MSEPSLQLRVNSHKLLRNLRYTFSNTATVLSELLQNGRRAGAARIDVTYDPATAILRVIDDGIGIRDFQILLTLGESGWDEAIQDNERPFGMGFLAALFAARNIEVSSLGKRIRFFSDTALDETPIRVHDAPFVQGTAVTMSDVQIADCQSCLKQIVTGFPVPVFFNGDELKRPHAVDQLHFRETPVGLVQFDPVLHARSKREPLLYLQGLPVYRPEKRGAAVYIVHLDPSRFLARMPDRDRLINEKEALEDVSQAVRALYLDEIAALKNTLPPRTFAEQYYGALRQLGGLHLLNDIDYLPGAAVFSFYAEPRLGEIWNFLEPNEQGWTRASLAKGDFKLCSFVDWEVTRENVLSYAFAKHAHYAVLDDALDEGHWIWEHVIGGLDEYEVEAEPVKVIARATFSSSYAPGEVLVCDGCELSMFDEKITITEAAVFDPDNGTFIVPAQVRSGEVLLQANPYLDEYEKCFADRDADDDMEAFITLLNGLSISDPRRVLENLLERAGAADYAALDGTEFVVSIKKGKIDVRPPVRAKTPRSGVEKADKRRAAADAAKPGAASAK